MSNTITAIYRTIDAAEEVRAKIAELGVPSRNVHVIDGADRKSEIDTLHLPEDEARTYRQAVSQGHCVVSADVEEDLTQATAAIMRHPEQGVDINAYEADYRASPDYEADSRTGDDPSAATSVELAEERLVVGKRVTDDHATAHVRTYVQEVPVEERIRLREEHLSVERRPVDRVVTGADADNLFQDRDIEVKTRSEEAVVSKETVVSEEVIVGKEVTEHEEVIRETLRKTDVDIDADDKNRR